MKTKLNILLVILLPVLLYSCAAPYQVSTNARLKGDWVVSSADVQGDLAGTQITSPIFEDLSLACFVGSKWTFFEGGGGNYLVNTGDDSCVKGNRKINWEVVTLQKKSHYLQFYRFNAPKGIQADKFTLYIAEIKDLTKKNMVLSYPIKYHDKTGNILITLTLEK